MKKVWVLLILVFLLVGCGKANSNDTNNDGSGIVAGEIRALLEETSPLVFQYEVNNQTEKEGKLEFSSSQRFDYSVETNKGEQIYLFSSVTMFLAVLGEEIIRPGEALRYEIDLHDLDLKPGNYLLTAWLTPKDGKAYSITKQFTVK
ncbi:BsuPI-related putative proteinase inhibitor [Niallia oryzisoli]|uniref:BsuPI-related putative proteinase inhibitor n=1 Tax=Niallia oryzisoli TaxID=1737571 RepID=UPI0037369038